MVGGGGGDGCNGALMFEEEDGDWLDFVDWRIDEGYVVLKKEKEVARRIWSAQILAAAMTSDTSRRQ
jgi:hypothetical protein